MDIIESLKEQLALAHEQIASLEQEKNDDYAEASSYAMSLYNNYYKNKHDAVNFELCTSVAAVITQIDNMATGIIAELEKESSKHIEICERHVSTRKYLEDKTAKLENLLKRIGQDLLMRAEVDSDGFKVVELSSSIWMKLKDVLEETK
jgi:hypothetical protein